MSWHSGAHLRRNPTTYWRVALARLELPAEWKGSMRHGAQRDSQAIRVRIGLNCAEVLVGNVGSSERLSYTVMGDGVNVASRLEGMNEVLGTTICISDSVLEAAKADVVARPLRKVQVKGRKHEFMIYALLAIRNSGDPELELRAGEQQLNDLTWKH